ncbi:hypothetical protein HZB74_01490 [Candidatus Saccharibacteria bacterium]|nr:hypothetical protein [Candidatus Saccharibacteria bacterium]
MSFATEESYAEELGEFREAAVVAEISPEILKMIDNFATPDVHVKGSTLLNAYSSGCTKLARNPLEPLAERPIEGYVPDSRLGRYLVNLINDSVERDSDADTAFTVEWPSKSHLVCSETETNLLSAMGHRGGLVTSEVGKLSVLYCTDEGEPVLFKKGVGVSSTISLREISINGIAYPPGMLFSLHQRGLPNSVNMAPHRMAVRPTSLIRSIAPLRLSEFALPKEEQSPAFMPDDERMIMDDEERAADVSRTMQMTVDELAIHLPKPEEIAAVIK